MGTIPEWIWGILVTTIIIGLVKYAWYAQGKRIDTNRQLIADVELAWKQFKDKLMDGGGILTMENHRMLCDKRMKERETEMTQSLQQLKEWLGLRLDLVNNQIVNLKSEVETNRQFIDDKIENKIMKELKKLNGKS